MVAALAKNSNDILDSLNSNDCHLIHMVLGISGEAGELLDAIKKSVIYKKGLDMNNIIEELGDIEFYMEGLRQRLNISREETLTANKQKLLVRYANFKYSDKKAQDRSDKK